MKRSVSIGILVLAIVPALTFILWRTAPGVLEEDHLIESVQAVLLFFAAALHLRHSRLSVPLGPPPRLYHQVLALFCLSLFGRELDLDKLLLPLIENLFRLFLGLAWIYLAVRLIQHRRPLWENRHFLLLHSGSLLAYAGIVLYGLSWFFDKELLLSDEPAMYLEETIQLQAALLFFIGALGYSVRDRLKP